MWSFFNVTGQSWLQLEELTLAFMLSALVGLEREIRQKSAGLRTYTLVGVSAALFMLISKYGFMDVISNGRVVVDPSRVAAQIVSGIGFIGGGVIFMRRDVVRGLTTAASVWLTAALKEQRTAEKLRISYRDGRGLLRTILISCTNLRFSIDHVEIEREGVFLADASHALSRSDHEGVEIEEFPNKGHVILRITVKGKRPISHLIARLSDIDGVVGVGTVNAIAELE
jgi:putative Mg2+ transporter-C (MgtC) family protein